jgi:hypothetical protein
MRVAQGAAFIVREVKAKIRWVGYVAWIGIMCFLQQPEFEPAPY